MSKGKGKGKGKLSKAEKEKLKKEEAERKAQEEEEARLKAEQEEREREEREQREKEERRIFEEQERARHQAEVDELNAQLDSNRQFLKELHKKQIAKRKWEKYTLCDGLPDPSCKRDINTFINLTKEDKTNLTIAHILEKNEVIIELIHELEEHINEVNLNLENEENAENIINNNKLLESYQETKKDLQALIFSKLDEATFKLLQHPENAIDPDSANIIEITQSKRFKVCVWGNSAKNPRVKQVEFANDEFTMELPKQMALSAIATRTLYIHFDVLSPLCSSFHYKPPKKSPELVEDEVQNQDGVEDSESQENSSQLEMKEGLCAVQASSALSANKGASKTPFETQQDGNATTPGLTNLEQQNQNNENGEMVEDEDDELLEEDVFDLRGFAPIGPLIVIDLLTLPHQAKEVNGWVMQQLTNGGLHKIAYGQSDNNSMSSINQSASTINTRDSSTLRYNLPIAFSISVDKNVLLHETPQLARWDEANQHWRTNGIADIRYEEADRIMFFRTTHFGPFALMQDIYLNMPFQVWQLRPTGLNECILTIGGAFIEVDIVIKADLCCVKFPEEKPQLNHIVEKWMKPQELITLLRSVGINLFPYQDGHKYVSISKKEETFVKQLYQQMAISASCCAFAWSKWNNDVGEEKIVVQATEWNSPKIPNEESFSLYLTSTRICCKLNMIEYATEFSEEIFPGSQMHPDLYHILRDGASEDMLKRLKDTSVVFIDCVQQFLTATNLFVYS